MAEFSPISLQIVDSEGNTLFSAAVPFEFGLSAKQLLERAFVLTQTQSQPDSLLYTLETTATASRLSIPDT